MFFYPVYVRIQPMKLISRFIINGLVLAILFGCVGNAQAQEAVRVVWWEAQDEPIWINRDYISNSPEHIRAILAFLSTRGGTDCEKIDSSVLDVELKDPDILEFDLDDLFTPEKLTCRLSEEIGYDDQCSDEHIRFIKKWFRRDQTVFRDLESCVRNPQAEVAKSTLIALEVADKGNTVEVRYAITRPGTKMINRYVERYVLELDTVRRTDHQAVSR